MSDSDYATRSSTRPSASKTKAGAPVKPKHDGPTAGPDQSDKGPDPQPDDDQFPDVAPNVEAIQTRVIAITAAGDGQSETWYLTVPVGGERGLKPWSTAVLNGAPTEASKKLERVSISAGKSVWRSQALRSTILQHAGQVFIEPVDATKSKTKPRR